MRSKNKFIDKLVENIVNEPIKMNHFYNSTRLIREFNENDCKRLSQWFKNKYKTVCDCNIDLSIYILKNMLEDIFICPTNNFYSYNTKTYTRSINYILKKYADYIEFIEDSNNSVSKKFRKDVSDRQYSIEYDMKIKRMKNNDIKLIFNINSYVKICHESDTSVIGILTDNNTPNKKCEILLDFSKFNEIFLMKLDKTMNKSKMIHKLEIYNDLIKQLEYHFDKINNKIFTKDTLGDYYFLDRKIKFGSVEFRITSSI